MEKNELELSWIMRLRIAAAIAIGISTVGLLGYKLLAPVEPMAPISLINGNITVTDILLCCGMALIAGFAASIIAVPYGKQIGPVAVPAGMCLWAIKTGSLARLFQKAPGAETIRNIYSTMQPEGLVWLSIIAAGYLGALAADKIIPHDLRPTEDKFTPAFRMPVYLVAIIAIIGTVLVAEKIICLVARDVSYSDAKLGSVFGNPGNAQMALAITVGFAAAAFLAKTLIGADFLWSTIAIVPLIYYISRAYGSADVVEYMRSNWPATFFVKPSAAAVPLQIAAFGSLGALWGYWLAARYHTWRISQA